MGHLAHDGLALGLPLLPLGVEPRAILFAAAAVSRRGQLKFQHGELEQDGEPRRKLLPPGAAHAFEQRRGALRDDFAGQAAEHVGELGVAPKRSEPGGVKGFGAFRDDALMRLVIGAAQGDFPISARGRAAEAETTGLQLAVGFGIIGKRDASL